MNNYEIKVKKLNRSVFSTIFIWVEDPAEKNPATDHIKEQQLTLAWIANHEGLQKRLKISGRDTEKLIKGLFNNFQDDFSDVITNLHQVMSVEEVLVMLKIIATFIRECVITNNQQIQSP